MASELPILRSEDLIAAVRALAGRGDMPVVLVDTIDLLLHEEGESVRTADLIEELRGVGARVVVACREQEAAGLNRKFERIHLGPYDEAEFPSAIKQHVSVFCPDTPPQPVAEKVAILRALASRGLGMAEVCYHPLLLRLLFEAYEGDFPNREVDARSVLATYFDNKVRGDVRGRKHLKVAADDLWFECFCLALALNAEGTSELKRADLLAKARTAAAAWGAAATSAGAAREGPAGTPYPMHSNCSCKGRCSLRMSTASGSVISCCSSTSRLAPSSSVAA